MAEKYRGRELPRRLTAPLAHSLKGHTVSSTLIKIVIDDNHAQALSNIPASAPDVHHRGHHPTVGVLTEMSVTDKARSTYLKETFTMLVEHRDLNPNSLEPNPTGLRILQDSESYKPPNNAYPGLIGTHGAN